MKNYGVSLKNLIFIGTFTKNQYRFNARLGEKRGGAFEVGRSGVDTRMHTMKLDPLLHKTRTQVLRFDMCKFMRSLSKITHQMWCDHPFSQRNETTE